MMTPIVASAEDLPEAIHFAQLKTETRWYVGARAQALGQAHLIPADWNVPGVGSITAAAFSQAERQDMATKGEAMDDGSYPIPNATYVAKAVEDFNRTGASEDVKKHIIQRAVALGATGDLPHEWVDPDNDGDNDLDASKDTDHDDADYRKKLGLTADAEILPSEALDYEDYGDDGAALVATAFTTEQRGKLADKGIAMEDGSFPVRNRTDLQHAIRAVGRAKDPEKAKKHIKRRAKALGAVDELPDSYAAVTASVDVVGLAKQALRARVAQQPLVAAGLEKDAKKIGGAFEEAMHPRGRDGKFITTGGRVLIHNSSGGKDTEGVVKSIDSKGIHVLPDGSHGTTFTFKASDLSNAPTARAHIGLDLPPGSKIVGRTDSGQIKVQDHAGGISLHDAPSETAHRDLAQDVGGKPSPQLESDTAKALDSQKQALRDRVKTPYEAMREAHDAHSAKQEAKAAELTAAHPGYKVEAGPAGGLNISTSRGKDLGVVVPNGRTGKFDVQTSTPGVGSMGHESPEAAVSHTVATHESSSITRARQSIAAREAQKAENMGRGAREAEAQTAADDAARKSRTTAEINSADNPESLTQHPVQLSSEQLASQLKTATGDRRAALAAESERRGNATVRHSRLRDPKQSVGPSTLEHGSESADYYHNPTSPEATHSIAVQRELKAKGYTQSTAGSLRHLTSPDGSHRITLKKDGSFDLKGKRDDGTYVSRSNSALQTGDAKTVAESLAGHGSRLDATSAGGSKSWQFHNTEKLRTALLKGDIPAEDRTAAKELLDRREAKQTLRDRAGVQTHAEPSSTEKLQQAAQDRTIRVQNENVTKDENATRVAADNATRDAFAATQKANSISGTISDHQVAADAHREAAAANTKADNTIHAESHAESATNHDAEVVRRQAMATHGVGSDADIAHRAAERSATNPYAAPERISPAKIANDASHAAATEKAVTARIPNPQTGKVESLTTPGNANAFKQDDATILRNAVQMYGTDRKKWSQTNLTKAAAAGDGLAATELQRRRGSLETKTGVGKPSAKGTGLLDRGTEIQLRYRRAFIQARLKSDERNPNPDVELRKRLAAEQRAITRRLNSHNDAVRKENKEVLKNNREIVNRTR